MSATALERPGALANVNVETTKHVRVFNDNGIWRVDPANLVVKHGFAGAIVWTIEVVDDTFVDIAFNTAGPFTEPRISDNGKVFIWRDNNTTREDAGSFAYTIQVTSATFDPTVENEPPPEEDQSTPRRKP